MKWASLLAALLLAVGAMPGAAAETALFEGTIIAGEAMPLFAPVGGIVEQLNAQPGDLVQAGAPILSMGKEQVCAPVGGKVIMPFARVGDAGISLQAEYGGVLFIEPEHPYMLTCTSSRAYQSNETLTVYPGETVYLRSNSDGKQNTGEGVITQAFSGSYTVSLLTGEFKLNEEVRVYRTEDYSSKSCIGTGRISRRENQAIQGSGVIAALYVTHGQTVHPGDLLFETVDAEPTYGVSIPDAQVTAAEDCIVLAVNAAVGDMAAQGQLVAEVAPVAGLCIRMFVSEDELYLVQVGQAAQITLNTKPDTLLEGTITRVAYLPESTTSSPAKYAVHVAFSADAAMRIGMTATVSVAAE